MWLPLTCPLLGTWSATQARVLIGNRTGDLSVCRPAFNPLSHTSHGYKWKFLKGFQEFHLSSVVCEMSIKHPSRYVKLTVGYIGLSKTQGEFINNCQYFSNALSNSCVVTLFFFSGDLWKYFQSTSLAWVPSCFMYWNPR